MGVEVYRMVDNILDAFGIHLPPVISAFVSGIPPLVTTLIAFGAAETALGNIGAGIAVGIAVTSMIMGIYSAMQMEQALQQAYGNAQSVIRSTLSFANTWRAAY